MVLHPNLSQDLYVLMPLAMEQSDGVVSLVMGGPSFLQMLTHFVLEPQLGLLQLILQVA